jgi:hypothetical protein
MARDISNSDDTIDSRDVIARIEDLQSERDALLAALSDAEDALTDFDPEEGGGDEAELQQAITDATRDLAAWDATSEAEELKALLALQDEAEGYAPDWKHGAQLIRDSYFERYCEELCQDIGDLPRDMPSYLVIDWEATARNIRVDYTSVEFDGVTYWVR